MDLILERYLARPIQKRRNPNTTKNTLAAFRHFQRYLDQTGKRASDVTAEELEAWIFDDMLETYAQSTVALTLTYIRAAYGRAIRQGIGIVDPTMDIELPQVDDAAPRTFTMDELRKILAETRNQREELAFFLFAFTGCRRFEVWKMKWSDIDFGAQSIEVVGKAAKRRVVPIHPVLAEVLMQCRDSSDGDHLFQWANGQHVCLQTFACHASKLIRRAGVDGSTHVFRKTVATNLDENHARENEIDEILGWGKSTVRGRHYVRVAPARLQHAILRLYAGDPLLGADALAT